MPQKVLAGRSSDASLQGDLVQVKVDQVILTRAPARALAEAQALGLKKSPVEVAVAYDGICVSDVASCEAQSRGHHKSVTADTLSHGILVARPGVGFAAPVHLERFAAPARLAVTDDPRMTFVGGIGMLALVVPPGQLGQALALGSVNLRPPRSVQILLSGKIRPFVCARDVSLELLRRGITEIVQRIDAQYDAPVVLEFAGPSARLLSVAERAVLCGIAPAAGAAGAIFVSDEKSEVFLRDQRRSKAHRTLAPDAGAPCDEVLSIDLATVDPLLLDETGTVRPVRDLADKPVHQVILGGDSGVTLRDMIAASALLKSKRVPPRLDFLVAPPSRQVLEVLAHTGALVDLVTTGARMIEPDRRVISGEIYPPAEGQCSLRTFDPDPGPSEHAPFIVASSETLAYTVATGHIGDPRSFKRPVRVTVPRVFPTDDVLIIRQRKSEGASSKKSATQSAIVAYGWQVEQRLELARGLTAALKSKGPCALLVESPVDAWKLASDLITLAPRIRAVLGTFIPTPLIALFAGVGIAPLRITTLGDLGDPNSPVTVTVPPASRWPTDGNLQVGTTLGSIKARLLVRDLERDWLAVGSARPATPVKLKEKEPKE
jgi:aconitate hydratase